VHAVVNGMRIFKALKNRIVKWNETEHVDEEVLRSLIEDEMKILLAIDCMRHKIKKSALMATYLSSVTVHHLMSDLYKQVVMLSRRERCQR
jgi:hypothetical protein